jgi:hypothetical protein
MSFVYYGLDLTFGPPLILASAQSQANWTTPLKLSRFLLQLQSLDFSDYDTRRQALTSIRALRIPQFFFTYPFNPSSSLPTRTQVRFPGSGVFVLLDSPDYQAQFIQLESALSYRDQDGPIDPALLQFNTAVTALQALSSSQAKFFDQTTWELSIPVVWSIFPPPP